MNAKDFATNYKDQPLLWTKERADKVIRKKVADWKDDDIVGEVIGYTDGGNIAFIPSKKLVDAGKIGKAGKKFNLTSNKYKSAEEVSCLIANFEGIVPANDKAYDIKQVQKVIAKPKAEIKKPEEPTINKDMPAWEVVLNVKCPKIHRPRRTSFQTLATVIGYQGNLMDLAEEMRKSNKVVSYICPDVHCPITYLKSMVNNPGMIDTRDPHIWRKLKAQFDQHPYPKVKGFKRFAQGTWSGGSYGKGKFMPANSAMEVPYEEGDYDYAREVIKALKSVGHAPGIEEVDGKIVAIDPSKIIKPETAKTEEVKTEAPKQESQEVEVVKMEADIPKVEVKPAEKIEAVEIKVAIEAKPVKKANRDKNGRFTKIIK